MESVPHTPFMIVIRSARRKLLRGSALAWRAHGPTGRGKSGRGHRGTGGGPAASPAPACVAGGASGGVQGGLLAGVQTQAALHPRRHLSPSALTPLRNNRVHWCLRFPRKTKQTDTHSSPPAPCLPTWTSRHRICGICTHSYPSPPQHSSKISTGSKQPSRPSSQVSSANAKRRSIS